MQLLPTLDFPEDFAWFHFWRARPSADPNVSAFVNECATTRPYGHRARCRLLSRQAQRRGSSRAQRAVHRSHREAHRVVIVGGVVLAQYALSAAMAQAYAMVSLVEQGWADQNDVAQVFDCSVRTLRRYLRRFEAGGLAALGHRGGYPRGRFRVAAQRRRLIEEFRSQGHSQREIARRVGVSEKAVRNLLRRLGWKPTAAAQVEMALEARAPNTTTEVVVAAETQRTERAQGADPNLSAFSAGAPVPRSADINPADRRNDRLLASLGLLDDAAPLFNSGANVPRAGVLLALPGWTGRTVRARFGPTESNVARQRRRLPLRRRPCPCLPRPASIAQSPCRPDALVDAGDFRLLGQRPGW